MGVMRCDRNGCESVLCDRYSHVFGYICGECYNELVHNTEISLTVSKFMDRTKNTIVSNGQREQFLNSIFPLE